MLQRLLLVVVIATAVSTKGVVTAADYDEDDEKRDDEDDDDTRNEIKLNVEVDKVKRGKCKTPHTVPEIIVYNFNLVLIFCQHTREVLGLFKHIIITYDLFLMLM